MSKKAYRLVGLLFLVLTLVALPGVASSAMWVGVELGGNFVASPDIDIKGGGAPTFTYKSARVEPSVIAGVTLGYDFVKEGFAGYNWPDWMKYFSFATDFTYNRMDFRQQYLDATFAGLSGKATLPKIEGYMAAWTFLFMAHYGFLPDSEVPAGRLHPYLGVGPAVLLSGINGSKFNVGTSSSVNVALVTEVGLRFMALKNVSLDAAFRYRYAGAPSYSFANNNGDVSLNDLNAFSFLFRTSYHF
jgi:opacity protein-like surface antigen